MSIRASGMLYEPAEPPRINRAEVLRYLGYGINQPDEATAALLERCLSELSAAVKLKCLYVTLPIAVQKDCVIPESCDLRLTGFDLAAHMKGCHTAVLMAATLSEQADRLIRRAEARDMAAGLIMDSCATAAIEQFCDDAESVIKQQYPDSFFTTRFSPGYGDLPIELQRAFLQLLDAPKKIGLCATDSSILTPGKSVTAIIGIREKTGGSDCHNQQDRTGCSGCRLRENCVFRKRGEFCGLSKTAE